jgi:tetratricopeptide (TPR) repeat protein
MPVSNQNPDPNPSNGRLEPVVAAFLLLATLVWAYWPALHGKPVWDDSAWLGDLAHLKANWSGLGRIWTDPTAMQQYYPTSGSSFWLDEQLWGSWHLPYHLENLLLHAVSVGLLWQLLTRLRVRGVLIASAFFALHPMMVESVAWITERKNVLSMALMLGGLLVYVRAAQNKGIWPATGESPPSAASSTPVRSWMKSRPYSAALLLCVLALGAKITAFVFAPALLLAIWWQTGRLRWRQDVLPTLPFFAVTLALGLLITWLEVYHVGAEGREFSASLSERLISTGRAFWFYPCKLLWPVDLCFIYPDWRTSPSGPLDWLWPLSIPVFLATLWLLRGQIGRGPLVLALFYLGAAFPVLGMLNVYGAVFSPVWDHWVYVPSVAVLIFAAAVFHRLGAKLKPRWLPLTLVALLLAVLTFQTRRQTPQYAGEQELWIETIRRNPRAWLALNNRGSYLVDQQQFQEAIEHFEEATATNPDYAEAWNNLGGALVRLGRYEESLEPYQNAIALDAELSPYTRHNMGNALLTIGRTDEAMEQFHASLALKPDYNEAHNSLGAALTQIGQLDEAIEHLQEAIRITPSYYQAHNNLGSALQKKGDLEAARQAYEKSAELRPDFVEARFNLGELHYKLGEFDAAIRRYEEVLKLRPDHARAQYNLGLIAADQGKLDEADAAYRKAIEIDPGYANAHNNLANNLLQRGRVKEAVEHFAKAIALDPDHVAAINNLAWVLATEADASLRDGAKAVALAKQAVDLTHREQPVALSTLAAAYAEQGMFTEAAIYARQARDQAARIGDGSMAASAENYLRQYEGRQPLRIARGKP